MLQFDAPRCRIESNVEGCSKLQTGYYTRLGGCSIRVTRLLHPPRSTSPTLGGAPSSYSFQRAILPIRS